MGIDKLFQIVAIAMVLALASSQRTQLDLKIREAQFLLIQASKQSTWRPAILFELK